MKKKPSRARKTSAIPTKIYTFGARPCSAEQTKVVFDQLFAAFLYRKQLVSIEQDRRAQFRKLRRTLSPTLNDLESQVDAFNNQIDELRKGLKKKKLRTEPEQVQRIEEIRALKKIRGELYPKIKIEHAEIRKKYFARADLVRGKLKNRGLKALAKSKELKSAKNLGPNDPARREVVGSIVRNMLDGVSVPLAWKEKVRLDLKAEDACRQARRATTCFPGVYLAVDAAAKKSFDDSKGDPLQKPYDQKGRVGIQLTIGKGLTVVKAFSGEDPNLKIELEPGVHLRDSKSDEFHPSHSRPIDLHAEERKRRAENRSTTEGEQWGRQAAKVRIKLSGHVKDAMYVDVPIVIHRPLPKDGVIKWAYLYVDRVGYKPTYELQLTIESKGFLPKKTPANLGILSVNFGWRVLDSGDIQVAKTWTGTEEGPEIKLPVKMIEDRKYVSRLLSHADDHFDLVIQDLVSWLRTEADAQVMLPLLKEALPQHVRETVTSIQEVTRRMPQWKSHARLRRLAKIMKDKFLSPILVRNLWNIWKSERLTVRSLPWRQHMKHKRARLDADGQYLKTQKPKNLYDEVQYLTTWFKHHGVTDQYTLKALYLEWWRRQDEHLINWARSLETRLTRHRREIYRTAASEWSKGYRRVLIEKWDKSKTAETPESEDDIRKPQEENANAIRQFAGISVCTRVLKEVLGKALVERNPTGITTTHFGCGGITTGGLTTTIMLLCTKCGKLYDQNINAAQNLWSDDPSIIGSD